MDVMEFELINHMPKRLRLPEIRARSFDREDHPAARVGNLLSRKQQNRLRSIGTVLEYSRNDATVFSEGEDAHFVYLVMAGLVRITRHSNTGRRQLLALMLPGDLFGLPECGLHVNSAETVSPTTLYRLPWINLREMLIQEPELQINFLIRTAFDLRQAQRRIMIFGQQNITQRLASFLVDFTQYPEFYDERSGELKLPLTRFDIGDYLGTSAETVVRSLAKLENLGLLRRRTPRLIEILDIRALRKTIRGCRRENRH